MDVIARLLDPDSYAYNIYALPQFVCAFITFLMGGIIAMRERASSVGLLYVCQTLALGTWFLGFGGAYLAIDPTVAQLWIKLGHIGVSIIPATTFHFTVSVLGLTTAFRQSIQLTWAVVSVLLTAIFIWPQYFRPPYLYWWGYYPHYTPYSFLLMLFLAALMAASFLLYARAYRKAHPGSSAERRAKLLFLGFGVAALGAIDFLPAFGVPLYPFGYVPVLFGVAVTTYVTWRYRLVDITPEFAAKQIIDTMNDALLVFDKEGVTRLGNDTAFALLGIKKDTLIGRPLPRTMRNLLSKDELTAITRGEPLHNREILFTRGDGVYFGLSLSVSIMRGRDKSILAYICLLRDVTERKQAEEKIRFLAYYDSLTGLPNRALFQERLQSALASAKNRHSMVALLFLDLDHFKRINDTLGHTLGDRLLQAVAGRLRECIRSAVDRPGVLSAEGTVARLGGDEFIVALCDIERIQDVTNIVQRVLVAMAEPLRLDRHDIAVTASVGVSVYPHDGEDAETLLKNADTAMYQAKEAGRNSYLFYDKTMNATTYNRLALEAKLRKALEQDKLLLHYQPQIDMYSGRLIGVEALLRWRHPELGLILPEQFISLAEESGLILPIGEWVLYTACAQARAWQDAGLQPMRIAVNISGRQFRARELTSSVRGALQAAQLESRWLELELTESILMQDALHTIETLRVLKAMGVRLSVDDFGTGYSSLSYLRRFPIDMLKIDRSFVHDIAERPDDVAIVGAIIAMANSLKLDVVGEGVETERQLAFLQQQGCGLGQGYLFSKPLPAKEFEAWLRAQRIGYARPGAGAG